MKKWAAIAAVILVPALAAAVKVEGNNYPGSVTLEGKSLKLIGAGLREKWFFDVYSLGAYSESGQCRSSAIIKDNEVKYLRIDMLRDVSAEKMATTIGESFEEHLPRNASAELKQQSKKFQAYFKKEFKEKTVVEFLFVPGTGTSIKQNGKSLGPPLKGKAFQEVFWDIYFGKDSCCDDLKEDILEICQKKG